MRLQFNKRLSRHFPTSFHPYIIPNLFPTLFSSVHHSQRIPSFLFIRTSFPTYSQLSFHPYIIANFLLNLFPAFFSSEHQSQLIPSFPLIRTSFPLIRSSFPTYSQLSSAQLCHLRLMALN